MGRDGMIFNLIPGLDALALCSLAAGMFGYAMIADKIAWGKRPMAKVMGDYRHRWMERILERDNRMPDVQIVQAYMRSGGLFISTALLVLAEVVAMLGQFENLRSLVYEISFSTRRRAGSWS